MPLITDIENIDLITDKRPAVDSIDNSTKIGAIASVTWSSEQVEHTDETLLDNLNAWRDFFPPEIDMQLSGKTVGDVISCNINDDDFIPPWREQLLHTVRPENFNRHFNDNITLTPRVGRFYPRGIFSGVKDNFVSNMLPCRLVEVHDDRLVTDFNHVLAKHECTLDLHIAQLWSGSQEHGGRCNDIVQMCTDNGVGMQARWLSNATNFWEDGAFSRQDAEADHLTYQQADMTHHFDRACRAQLASLYARLLPAGGRIIDYMASFDSHLPDNSDSYEVSGIGLNQQELDANSRLSERLTQDLNRNSQLDFDDATFDAAICTDGIQYLIDPLRSITELARTLKPGAPFIITFSNRWLSSKVIQLWAGAHDFERMGIVTEYLLESGLFDNIHTWSLHHLPRPLDDIHANQFLYSDPIFAVWGYKR